MPVSTTQANSLYPEGSSPSIVVVVGGCLQGCPADWEALVRRCGPVCRRVVLGVLPRRHASWAEDVVQQTLTILLRKLDRWRGSEDRTFDAWVGAIARREAIRTAKQLRRWERLPEDRPAVAYPGNVRGEDLQWIEAWDSVAALSRKLSAKQRMILQHLLEGHRPAAIAVRVAIPESTVRGMVRLIRKEFSRTWGTPGQG